ncbi:Pre-mRNA 3'-end-processing factor FIP1 [Halotydeus destructor]|nr:Pre-mRNA 3'-end-processing factor FIP1 [Halotydeus destructor]
MEPENEPPADPVEDEDMWLYGEEAAAEIQEEARQQSAAADVDNAAQNGDVPLNGNDDEPLGGDNVVESAGDEVNGFEDNHGAEEASEENVAEKPVKDEDDDDDEDDEDDDDIQITIGDIKPTAPSFPYGPGPVNLNITKRGPAFAGQGASNAAGKTGKTTTLDIDSAGNYNGQSIYDVNVDSLEGDKPWRKPGADITDYFNYGFTEEMWRIYCERQKKLRAGEATGSVITVTPGLGGAPPGMMSKPFPPPMMPGKPGDLSAAGVGSIVNDNSKYSGGMLALKKAGPPPGRKPSGTIDVIGGGGGSANPVNILPSRRPPDAKEHFINVLGGRPPLGPPPFGMPPPFPPGMGPPPGMDFSGMPPGMGPPGMFPRPPVPFGRPMPPQWAPEYEEERLPNEYYDEGGDYGEPRPDDNSSDRGRSSRGPKDSIDHRGSSRRPSPDKTRERRRTRSRSPDRRHATDRKRRSRSRERKSSYRERRRSPSRDRERKYR